MTGQNLNLLRMFLNLLLVRSDSDDNGPVEFQIDDTYWVDVSLLLLLNVKSSTFLGCWRRCIGHMLEW